MMKMVGFIMSMEMVKVVLNPAQSPCHNSDQGRYRLHIIMRITKITKIVGRRRGKISNTVFISYCTGEGWVGRCLLCS